MILSVGVGNTNIRCAVGTLGCYTAAVFSCRDVCCGNAFARLLSDSYGADVLERLCGCIISSVVPSKRVVVEAACAGIKGGLPVYGIDMSKSSVDFSQYRSRLGEDRIVCCTAAAHKHTGPLIVVDMGTATTVNVIDKSRHFLGGAILTGVYAGLHALSTQTAQLPSIEDFEEVSLIGADTSECLISGAAIGTACMIEGFVRRIKCELRSEATVILTGGNAPAIMPLCEFDFIHEDSLLLEGVFLHYE